MKLSANFSLEEFTASETAERRRLDNSLPSGVYRVYGDAYAGRDVIAWYSENFVVRGRKEKP